MIEEYGVDEQRAHEEAAEAPLAPTFPPKREREQEERRPRELHGPVRPVDTESHVQVLHERVTTIEGVRGLDGTPRAVLRDELVSRYREQGEGQEPRKDTQEEQSESIAARVKHSERQRGQRKELDGRAQRDVRCGPHLAAALEREGGKHHER